MECIATVDLQEEEDIESETSVGERGGDGLNENTEEEMETRVGRGGRDGLQENRRRRRNGKGHIKLACWRTRR